MFVVIDQEDFTETVDISAKSFVDDVLGHVANLRIRDYSERGLNLDQNMRFLKLRLFQQKMKDVTPLLERKEAFQREPPPGFLFSLKKSPESLVRVDDHTGLADTCKRKRIISLFFCVTAAEENIFHMRNLQNCKEC